MISMECHLLCVILCTIQVYNKRVLAKKEKEEGYNKRDKNCSNGGRHRL
jgi:hypothetical protein